MMPVMREQFRQMYPDSIGTAAAGCSQLSSLRSPRHPQHSARQPPPPPPFRGFPATARHVRGTFHGPSRHLSRHFRRPGKTEDSARFSAAFLCAPIGGMLSHPPDTVKTCMQGDIEGAKYKGYGATANAVIKERGLTALWAGYPWRCFRQLVAHCQHVHTHAFTTHIPRMCMYVGVGVCVPIGDAPGGWPRRRSRQ